MSIVGLVHVNVNCSDFDRSLRFYELLGFKRAIDVPPTNTAEVAAALDLDVAGGEQDWDLETWRRMIDMRAVDIVQPDILYVGGMVRAMRVARMGAAAGLPCTPHAANLSLVTPFTMHLMRALPLPGRYLEVSIEGPDYYPWQDGLFLKSPCTVSGGRVRVSDAPGWGVEIAPEWLARSTYQASEADT